MGPINVGFTDSRRADVDYSSDLPSYSNTASVSSMRTALNTYDPNTYTDAVLDAMTTNDMVFAWRNITNPESIHDEMPAQEARP